MKSLYLLIISLCIYEPSFAYLIACPTPNSLQFNQQFQPPAWNEWRATGLAPVLSNPKQNIAMSGESQCANSDELLGASYYPGDLFNDFICLYLGQTDQHQRSDLVLAETKATHLLDHCRFKQGDAYECEGGVKQCELVCH